MTGLVFIDGKLIFTTSLIIASGIGVEHRAVVQLLKKYEADFLDLESSAFRMRKFKTKGREGELFELGEIHATFLLTLMRNSEKVVKFKKDLTKEFYAQRDVISRLVSQQKDPNWQSVRSNGKAVYKQKTDVIKQFVDYATLQGSKSANKYYTALAKMENSSLFFIEQKYKNLRDIMTIKQLMQVGTADDVIDRALKEGMESGDHYKEIYQLAKERVISFAEIIGKSPVHDMQLNDKQKGEGDGV
tara:strand:+ start:97 stop:831 length:735 start_codon:yes stop_codon:yes gene_type:complete